MSWSGGISLVTADTQVFILRITECHDTAKVSTLTYDYCKNDIHQECMVFKAKLNMIVPLTELNFGLQILM